MDLQDLQSLPGHRAIGTGVGSILAPSGPLQLGALVVVDVDELRLDLETPVAAWMPSGRVATYNATHLTAGPDRVDLRCLVDDTTADVAVWTAEVVADAPDERET